MLNKLRSPRAKKILLVVAVAVIVLILIGRMILPTIVKSVIQSVGTDILGVPVTVENVDLSIFAGSGTIEGLAIASPDGFSQEPFISVESAGGNIGLLSLLGEPITIQSATAKGVKINLEVTKEGKQNLRTLAEKFLPPDTEPPGEQPEPSTTDKPAAPVEEAAMMAILVELVQAEDIEVTVTDEFAMPGKKLTTATRVASAELRNLMLPAPGTTGEWKPMTISVAGIQLDAPSWYQEPQILDLTEASLSIDVALAMSTIEKPKVEIPSIESKGLQVIVESEIKDDEMMLAPMESLHAFLNATSLEDPTLYVPEEVEEEDSFFAGALDGSGELLNSSIESGTGAIGSLFGKKNDKEKQEDKTPSNEEKDPAPTETKQQEEPEELPIEYVLLKSLNASDIKFDYIEKENDEIHRAGVIISANINSIVYPNPDNQSSSIKINIKPVPDNGGTMDVTINGNVVEIGEGREVTANVKSNLYPLNQIKGISDGTLRTDIDITVKDSTLTGDIDYRLDDFNYDKTKMGRAAITTCQTLKLLINNRETPDVIIPPTPLDDSSPKTISANILKSILSGAGDLTDIGTDAVKTHLLENGKEVFEGSDEKIDDVKEEAGKILNMFGKKKKD